MTGGDEWGIPPAMVIQRYSWGDPSPGAVNFFPLLSVLDWFQCPAKLVGNHVASWISKWKGRGFSFPPFVCLFGVDLNAWQDVLIVWLYVCIRMSESVFVFVSQFHPAFVGYPHVCPDFSNMSCIQNQHMVLFGQIVLSFSRVVLGHPSLRHDIQQCFECVLISLKVKWLILSTTAVISNPGVWMLHWDFQVNIYWKINIYVYIWYDMIWYDMIWYDMIWYDMIYIYILLIITYLMN